MATHGELATLIDTGELEVRGLAVAPAPVTIDIYEADDDDEDDSRTELTELPPELLSQTKLRVLPLESSAVSDPPVRPPHFVPEPPPMRAAYSSYTDERPLPAPLPIAVARELTRRVRARTGRTPASTLAVNVPAPPHPVGWLPEPPPPTPSLSAAPLPMAVAVTAPRVPVVKRSGRTPQRVRARAILPWPAVLMVLGVASGVLAEHLQRGDTVSALEWTVHSAQGYVATLGGR